MHKSQTAEFAIADVAVSLLRDRKHMLGTALDDLCMISEVVDSAADCIIRSLRAGGRVLAAGNGGSAAESQHFATELVGRFLRERAPYAAISLTADTAILTAVANDYGFDSVFARQVTAYGRPGDTFVGFSTSGKSQNLICAAEAARIQGMTVIAITGRCVSPLGRLAHVAIRVPADEIPVVQELHTIVLHVICDLVEQGLACASDPGNLP
jgi:D-sedoheptulose 7-phosphate isomerase